MTLCLCGCGREFVSTNKIIRKRKEVGFLTGHQRGNTGKFLPRDKPKPCACGCGRIIPSPKYPSYTRKYIHGHNPQKTGKESKNFKGESVIQHGYSLTYFPEHHDADKRGRVLTHRLVYEQYYKCCLLPYIEIHHNDKNTLNNNITNLIPLTKPEHTRIHKLLH